MEKRRPDRRVDRTRAALMQAFIGLLFAEDFESVTVAAIVARADVGRSTFYTHFRNRDDILKASLLGPSQPLARLVEDGVAAESLLPLLAHFHAQRRLARAFTTATLRRLWVRRLADVLEPLLTATAMRRRARPLLPIPMIAAQIAELQIALVVHWLDQRQPPPADAIAESLLALTRATVAALLRPTLPGEM